MVKQPFKIKRYENGNDGLEPKEYQFETQDQLIDQLNTWLEQFIVQNKVSSRNDRSFVQFMIELDKMFLKSCKHWDTGFSMISYNMKQATKLRELNLGHWSQMLGRLYIT